MKPGGRKLPFAQAGEALLGCEMTMLKTKSIEGGEELSQRKDLDSCQNELEDARELTNWSV